ncbi:MAG: NADH-quinone oxidoreductase subunit J [Opitutales bacterium]
MTTTAAFIAFALLGIVTLGAALAAVALRNLVHCGLSLALAFIGIGGFYLLLGAEFVGFVQLLVYVGAVAVLIMFVILLSHPDGGRAEKGAGETSPIFKYRSLLPGLGIPLAVFAVLAVAIGGSPSLRTKAPEAIGVSIESLGKLLVSSHLLPLQITGVLLTSALIGGVIFALKEEK